MAREKIEKTKERKKFRGSCTCKYIYRNLDACNVYLYIFFYIHKIFFGFWKILNGLYIMRFLAMFYNILRGFLLFCIQCLKIHFLYILMVKPRFIHQLKILKTKFRPCAQSTAYVKQPMMHRTTRRFREVTYVIIVTAQKKIKMFIFNSVLNIQKMKST